MDTRTRPRTISNVTADTKTILVCSGGGVYGAVQAGMLLEITRSGFRPDAIVGVSAGALNGAYMACDFTETQARELIAIWESLHRRSVFPSRAVGQMLRVARGQDALHPDNGLRNLVERVSPIADLADTNIPVHVGAVDVADGHTTWWDRGPIVPRLLASAALPGVISPVPIDGQLYFDGGVVNPVPIAKGVDVAHLLDARRIVVLDVSSTSRSRQQPGTALETLLRAFAHARTRVLELEHHLVPPHIEILTVSGAMPDVRSTDFHRSPELAQAGQEIARCFLAENGERLLDTRHERQPTFSGRMRSALNRLARERTHRDIRERSSH